jgi:hypothetical protein
MESLTTNPTPSPLDQAYQRYKDDLRTKITGAESDQDLVRGIIDNEVSREKVSELKKKIITLEDFKMCYYPRELSEGFRLKEEYTEDVLVGRHDPEIIGNGSVDFSEFISGLEVTKQGDIVSAGCDCNVFLWKKRNGQDYTRFQVAGNKSMIGGIKILPGGGDIVSIDWDGFTNKWVNRQGGIFQKSFVSGVNDLLNLLDTLPDGSIFSCSSRSVYFSENLSDGTYQNRKILSTTDRIDQIQALPDGQVVIAKNGSLWNLKKYSDSFLLGDQIVKYEDNYVRHFQALSNGDIYVARQGGIDIFRKLNGKYEKFAENSLKNSRFQVLNTGSLVYQDEYLMHFCDITPEGKFLEKGSKKIKGADVFRVLPDASIVYGSGDEIRIIK